jgi:hypothetical protein
MTPPIRPLVSLFFPKLLVVCFAITASGPSPLSPGPARSAENPVAESVSSPRFNDNYRVKTSSLNGKYTVVSTPFFCTNETAACVKVLDHTDGNIAYSFIATRAIGSVYVATNDATLIIKVPTGIGLSPVVAIAKESSQADVYVEIYRSGTRQDSMRIPSVSPTLSNKRYFFTGRRLDRSNVLHSKPDTLAIVTCRGLALLAHHGGKVTATFTADYARLKSFKPVLVHAHTECFPYPQPTSCREVREASTVH